jgi:hypothetical protein
MGSNAGGFDFELVKRNALLESKGVKPPRAWKTGTTIAGVIYKVGPSWQSSPELVAAVYYFTRSCQQACHQHS